MSDNRAVVARALRAWGSAIRGDWGSIDGRTCRDEVGELAALLKDDAPEVTYAQACRSAGVCWFSKAWPEHCPDAESWDCPHMEADSEETAVLGETMNAREETP